jgi:tRNA(His) guanylyltransferase
VENMSLGDRMKVNYENIFRQSLPMRMPVIMRIDGKSFGQWTKGLDKPFDETFIDNMIATTEFLCAELQNATLGYVQSDEISILMHPYKRYASQPWFGNEIQKMVSVAAGTASGKFSMLSNRYAAFDARVFVIPETEVANYFLWRQQDASRNSVQMLARSLYSHSECENKNMNDMQEMTFQKGVNWNDLATEKKRGACVIKTDEGWTADREIPLFSQDRDYIDRLLAVEES